MAERNSYDPWGKRRYSNGSDDPSGSLDSVTSRGFTGQEHLSEVGLIHFNARLYDPLVGRFTSADSIVPHPGDPQSYNRYAYVRNRPLSATDPSGHADGGALPIIHSGANYWSTFNWASFVASGAGNQAYLAAVYGRIIGAAHYGASILPFAIGNQLQYRQYLSFLRVYGPQLQAAGFFMTRQPNLTPPPEPAPASTIAAGYAISSNAFGYAAGWVINNHRLSATILGQALDFCGVICDAGAIISVSSGLGPYGRGPVQAVGAVARGLRSFANFGAAERAAAVAAEEVGPGAWQLVNESMSGRAAAYQMQIAGRSGQAYIVDGVKFDGFAQGTLLDAKGPGYGAFVRDGEFRSFFRGQDSLANQAQRQISVSNGASITWHVAEPDAADAIRTLLQGRGIEGITVVHTPAVP